MSESPFQKAMDERISAERYTKAFAEGIRMVVRMDHMWIYELIKAQRAAATRASTK